MDAIRVVLADDHPIVGVGMQIVAQVRHLLEDLAPDILLLDMALATEPEPPVARCASPRSPSPQVFVLRGHNNRAYVFGLLMGESDSAATEDEALQVIAEAIRGELARKTGSLSRKLVAKLPARPAEGLLTPTIALTAREREILRQLTTGESDQAMSQHLGISKATVRYHLKNIYAKLGITRRSEAIAWAVRAGLGV